MDKPNIAAEQQYLAAEREAELRSLLNDPDYYPIPCDMHADVVTVCSGCQWANKF